MSGYKKNNMIKIKSEVGEENKKKDLNDKIEKINEVINRQFQIELDHRQSQLDLIQQRLNEAQKSLHLLRYILITTYYKENDKISKALDESVKEELRSNKSQIHPAIKKLLGKNVDNYKFDFVQGTRNRKKTETVVKLEKVEKEVKPKLPNLITDVQPQTQKETEVDTIRNRKKSKYRVVVGNISKSIVSNSNEDKSTHKWMVYVRGSRENPDISHFVQKVVLYLHPSYRPNDVVEIKEAPFHLSRRGWGEFPLRVQIHFKCILNKPIDIVHNLKLDNTFTGRQTLGNETLVDLFLYDLERNLTEKQDVVIKKEIEEESYDTYKRKLQENDLQDSNKKFKTESRNDEECLLVIKQEPMNFEHDYCFTSIKKEPTEETCDFKYEDPFNYNYLMEHSYSSISVSNADKSVENTSTNQQSDFIYGLTDFEQQVDVIEEPVLEDLKIVARTFTPNNCIGENRVISIKKHRKPQESLLKNVFQTQVPLLRPNLNGIDYKKYEINFPSHRFKCAFEALPYLFKRLPLISKFAWDVNYKCTYPYATISFDEYQSWSVGRRMSSEWFRAKTIQKILLSSHLLNSNNLTTKDLILYGRSYGYTPLASYHIFNTNQSPSFNELNNESQIPKQLIATNINSIEPDVDVDIVNIPSNSQKSKATHKEKLIDHSCQMACSYVKETVLDIGIVLKPEEIIEGVLFNAAERMLLQAGLSLAEELIRKARSNVVYRGNFNEETAVIGTDDIKKALDSKPHCKTLMERYANERKYLI